MFERKKKKKKKKCFSVRLAEYLGWSSEELVGQSVFEFYHALDNLALDKSFKSRE